jgi:hypothetical protein
LLRTRSAKLEDPHRTCAITPFLSGLSLDVGTPLSPVCEMRPHEYRGKGDCIHAHI